MEGLLAHLPISLKTLADVPPGPEVEETGETFLENAELKARSQAKRHAMWTLGEDSGLCVDALQGAPGVYSARFAGPDANDENNNNLLLERLATLEGEERSAHYVSAIALADPNGNVVATASGACQGLILRKRRGSSGFGYDPLFLVREYHRTFAELGPIVKANISHRARSLAAILRVIEKFVAIR